MSKPKINHPLSDLVIPSSKKKIKVRPMLVKEEKILHTAKMSGKVEEILAAMKQIVDLCIVDDVDVDKLSLFDVEFLFVRLRAISVNNIAKFKVKDKETEEEMDIAIDLNSIEVKFPEGVDKTVEFQDFVISLKYPAASLFDQESFYGEDSADEMIVNSIESVFRKDEKFEMTPAEIREFVDELSIPTYNKITEFVDKQPHLFYEEKYKNSQGAERTLTLKSLEDFFIFL